MTLLGGKGYSFLCGSAEQQCNAQPDRWWMSMEKPQLQGKMNKNILIFISMALQSGYFSGYFCV